MSLSTGGFDKCSSSLKGRGLDEDGECGREMVECSLMRSRGQCLSSARLIVAGHTIYRPLDLQRTQVRDPPPPRTTNSSHLPRRAVGRLVLTR